jgi:hypothetical protein
MIKPLMPPTNLVGFPPDERSVFIKQLGDRASTYVLSALTCAPARVMVQAPQLSHQPVSAITRAKRLITLPERLVHGRLIQILMDHLTGPGYKRLLQLTNSCPKFSNLGATCSQLTAMPLLYQFEIVLPLLTMILVSLAGLGTIALVPNTDPTDVTTSGKPIRHLHRAKVDVAATATDAKGHTARVADTSDNSKQPRPA